MQPTSASFCPRDHSTTSYRPDREYVDGALVERNLGERNHSWIETDLSSYFVFVGSSGKSSYM